MLNLLTDAWLPVIRRQTGRCVIRPAQIVEFHDEDAVIAIDWPRPDFRIATLELLTGLLATMIPPRDGDDWLNRWHAPPGLTELDEVFAPFAHAFALDGDGPRFLQDLEDLAFRRGTHRAAVDRDAGRSQPINKNTDLMVHRGRASASPWVAPPPRWRSTPFSRGHRPAAPATASAFAVAGLW